jgi:hypothetical protein
MKNLIADFNAEVVEKIFKPTTESDSKHEISNNNYVKVVNFVTQKNVKSTM